MKYDPSEVRKLDGIIASDLEVVARRGTLGFGATARLTYQVLNSGSLDLIFEF